MPTNNGGDADAPKNSAVVVTKLNFTYDGTDKSVLKTFDLDLPAGSRCLLIGQNGAGKSTLLRVLAGRHLTSPDEAVIVLGKHAFRDTTLNKDRSFLSRWTGVCAPFLSPARRPFASGYRGWKHDEERPGTLSREAEELLNLLGVDPNWRMHQVSDGQRRRVQLLLGLVKPFKILLIDEVTTSLDVVVRQDLLIWLQKESVERGATIIYATHIFDGLDEWPTHLTYLTRDGSTGWQGRLEELEYNRQLKEGETCTLLKVACHWLRGEQEEARRETRDARARQEAASGDGAIRDRNPNLKAYVAGGGYAPGRLAHQGI